MNPLSRVTGKAIDRVLGLPATAVPYVVRRNVPVAMPDGVVLLGDHYRPAGHDRPLPVVLIRSPYGRGGASFLFAALLARRGFQVFIQSTRGTFGSGGQFRPFLTEREDGLATVAWVRRQPWCDGRVSMAGASYLGHTQWAVGPWLHGDPGELREITRQDIAWLDHHLRGGPPPPGAPVRVFLQQAGTWLEFADWPPPAAATVCYLRASGRLSPDAEPGDAPPGAFVYNPADPTPSAGGPLLRPPGKQVNNAAIEARPDVLIFTSDPFPAGADLVGPVSARIFVRTGREHADLFVRVCDVDLKGVSRNITDGIRRLSPQTVPAPDVQPGGDGILGVDLELYPTAYRVRAGHRIRVQVSGGAFPRFARNFGTPEPFAVATRALRCRFEIHHDSRHPAHVLLPVLPHPGTPGPAVP